MKLSVIFQHGAKFKISNLKKENNFKFEFELDFRKLTACVIYVVREIIAVHKLA